MVMKRTLMVCGTACLLAFLACQAGQNPSQEKPSANPHSPPKGFTGPDVPAPAPMLGDYVNIGVRTPENRTDRPRLLAGLKEAGARDYMHLVWNEKQYPGAWQDFQLMAPEFEKAEINLWLYLTPPSEGAPEPFGDDYVKWAVECAKIARQYPVVKGICIDDFNENVARFTPSYCREMMSAAHEIAPHLSFLVVGYFGYQDSITSHVEGGAIDGVIFPYFYPHKNLSDASPLRPQINAYRAWLDEHVDKGGSSKKMPLIVMVYAVKHSQSADSPTPAYVKKCLEIGLEATRAGLVSGVVTYCLPKDNPEFVKSVAEVYRVWNSVTQRSIVR